MSVSPLIFRTACSCRPHRTVLAFFRVTACAVLAAVFSSPDFALATIVRMETNGLGAFNIELYDADAPQTVANFLRYRDRGVASNGGYDSTVIHRSVPDFIIQGGGYGCCFFDGNPVHIATDPPVPNEFSPSRSNVRGTIAMAKLGGQPDSATSEWFINLADNSANLDIQNGGFTVFGRVLDPGMDVVDAIAALPASNQGAYDESFGFLNLSNFPKQENNFVFVVRVCINNDGDSTCSDTEDLAPDGDGNGDGIPDRDQANVTSILTQFGTTATFSLDTTMKFDSAEAVNTNTVLSRITTFTSPSNSSVHFNNGMFTFTMVGTPGSTDRLVILHDGASERPTHYYAYGPTADNPTPHWYDFSYDGETGAEIKNDRIILHFVDGKRGDDDLDSTNNSITHSGAQAVVTSTTTDSGSAQGGGCSIASTSSDTARGGDWIVVSLFLAFVVLARKRARDISLQGGHRPPSNGERSR